MSKRHEIRTVDDMLLLSQDEFVRMLPDLLAWYALAKDLKELGADASAFIWIDDGIPGEIHHVTLTVKETGESELFKGPAFRDVVE